MPDARPVFSGGTGRSGTTVIAKLLRCHPMIRASRPLEIRCVTDSAGLLDVCLGPTAQSPWRLKALDVIPGGLHRSFRQRMRSRWWERTNRLGHTSGLHRGMTTAQRDEMLRRFGSGIRENPRKAGRDFISDLMTAQGVTTERYWIDTSPPNVVHADRIDRIVPDALFVHMVRDGRDTAASVINETWGPNDPESAITWWEERMQRAHRALSRIPQDRVLTLSLEDLVVRDRESGYRAILEFFDLPDRPRMRRFFAEKMPADRVRIGSWASRVADPGRLESAYASARDRLIKEGIDVFERS